MSFSSILKLAKRYSYFEPVLSKSKKCVQNLQLGHSGSLLRERIKSEWLYANVTNRDIHVHLYITEHSKEYDKTQFQRAFANAFDESKKLPFGIAKILIERSKEPKEVSFESAHFNFTSSTALNSTVILAERDAMQYFHYWQRLRKLWWKKIASNPGRFKLTEMEILSDDTSVVNIIAEYPWGSQHLESLTISPFREDISFNMENLVPMKVTNEMSLDVATVGLYCDAYYEDSAKNIVLQLNPKITPYKCIIGIRETDPSVAGELSLLAVHLSKELRKCDLTTVLLSDCSMKPIETQFERNDEWGIPYTIVLDSTTLKTGFIGLRNRDTTLEEEVHVSDITNYVVQLFSKTQ